jgi:preprotein translocase subunit SecG
MTGLIIVIHIIVCALLIGIILIQRGRGSGLVESFSGVESMFGTKTSAFLARTTTILSVLFFVTCLSLALLSAKKSRSLMKDFKAPGAEENASAVQVEIPKTQETKEPLKVEDKQPAQPQPPEGAKQPE